MNQQSYDSTNEESGKYQKHSPYIFFSFAFIHPIPQLYFLGINKHRPGLVQTSIVVKENVHHYRPFLLNTEMSLSTVLETKYNNNKKEKKIGFQSFFRGYPSE